MSTTRRLAGKETLPGALLLGGVALASALAVPGLVALLKGAPPESRSRIPTVVYFPAKPPPRAEPRPEPVARPDSPLRLVDTLGAAARGERAVAPDPAARLAGAPGPEPPYARSRRTRESLSPGAEAGAIASGRVAEADPGREAAKLLEDIGVPTEGAAAKAFGADEPRLLALAAELARRDPKRLAALFGNPAILDGYFESPAIRRACGDSGWFASGMAKNSASVTAMLGAAMRNPESLKALGSSGYITRFAECPSMQGLATDPRLGMKILVAAPSYLKLFLSPGFLGLAAALLPGSEATAGALQRLPGLPR